MKKGKEDESWMVEWVVSGWGVGIINISLWNCVMAAAAAAEEKEKEEEEEEEEEEDDDDGCPRWLCCTASSA